MSKVIRFPHQSSFYFGTCTYCGDIPKKKLLNDIGDGDKLVEWYCDKCFNDSMRQDGRRKKDIDKLN